MEQVKVKLRNVERVIAKGDIEMYKNKGYALIDTKTDNNAKKADKGTPKVLDELHVPELKEIAKKLEIQGYSNLNRDELLAVIKAKQTENE